MQIVIKGALRCPFHRKAEQEGTLLEIGPFDDRVERIAEIEKAFTRFYSEPKLSGILITLPKSLLAESQSLYDLRTNIIPYQSEMVAAQLSVRLYPFFLHHKGWELPEVDNTTVYAEIARCLHTSFKEYKYEIPESTADLADIMQKELTSRRLDEFNPGFRVSLREKGILAKVTRAGLKIYGEDKEEVKRDPLKNRNCFSIVTTPFYKKEFARYSDDIKLVATRIADIYNVEESFFWKIRKANAKFLKEYGFEIGLREKQAMPEGLWVPGMHW